MCWIMAELISSTKVGNKADGFCSLVSSGLLKWLLTGLTLYLPKGVCGPALVQWPVFRKTVTSAQQAQCYISNLLKVWIWTTGLLLPPCAQSRSEVELDTFLLSVGFVVWHVNHCYDILVLPVVMDCADKELGMEGEGVFEHWQLVCVATVVEYRVTY